MGYRQHCRPSKEPGGPLAQACLHLIPNKSSHARTYLASKSLPEASCYSVQSACICVSRVPGHQTWEYGQGTLTYGLSEAVTDLWCACHLPCDVRHS